MISLFAAWSVAAAAGQDAPLEIGALAEAWPAVEGAAEHIGPWWEDLGDPMLSEHVARGLVANPDLAAARARHAQSQGGALLAFSPLAPRASFDISASGQPADVVFRCNVGPIDPAEFGATGQDPVDGLCWQGNALLNVGWQLDVFGRQATQYSAARYEAEAAEGDQDAAALRVGSAVASAYLDVVAARAQVGIIESQQSAQRALLEVIELRYEQGGASGLDVLQQRQSVAGIEANLPTARANAASRGFALQALLAQPPGATLQVGAELPAPRPLPDIGTPDALLSRRPDLRAASRRVAASRARHSSALVGLAPTIGVSANAGWAYAVADEWSTIGTWGLGGNLSVPLFNGGAAHGGLRQAAAARDATARAYDTALLNAVRDVQSAAVLEREQALRHTATGAQVAAARAAYDEARDRYLRGIDTFLTVLQTQNALLGAELSHLQAHRDRLSARIQLWTALGGTGVNQ